jgi:hypothetical protein
MNAIITGMSLGIITILTIALLKLDKPAMYALILAAIGFLYVGFTWTDTPSLIATCVQAIAFLLLGYFGFKKSQNFLIAGYFLHGTWDLVYHSFDAPALIPPHYDLFCLSIDFTMGAYLLIIKYVDVKKVSKR